MFCYTECMSEITAVQLPAPQRGKILVVAAPRGVRSTMMTMLATLALQSRQVMVVDGGNVFDGYTLARELRQQTIQVHDALKRVMLSRVFTCYQMGVTLSQLPLDGTPVVVLDLLGTFFDENLSFKKRQRLLYQSLGDLRRIGAMAPVAIWVKTRSISGDEDQHFLRPVLGIASDIWELHKMTIPDYQLPLF